MDDGILQTHVQSRALKVLNGKSVRLAVILSKNTVSNIKFLQNENKHFESDLFHSSTSKALAEETNPNYLIQWIAKSLVVNFGEVRFYSDPNLAKSSKPDEFAVVNIYYDPLGANSEYSQVDIKIEFFDRNFSYVATATGSGKIKADHWGSPSDVEFTKIRKQEAHVRTDALMALDGSLSKILVKPVGWYPTSNAAKNK